MDFHISGMGDPYAALCHAVVHLFDEPPGGHFEQFLREQAEISQQSSPPAVWPRQTPPQHDPILQIVRSNLPCLW